MQLGYTILYVEDVVKTIEFYEKAFDLQRSFIDDSHDYGQLDTGTTILAFSSFSLMRESKKNPSKADPTSPCFEIAFIAEDVELSLKRALAAGATLVHAAEKTSWGKLLLISVILTDFWLRYAPQLKVDYSLTQ